MTAPATRTGLRPGYAALAVAYPMKSITRGQLYDELGIGELTALPQYENTCAIRLSHAVTKAGMALRTGGLRINAGPHKAKRIEPSMRKLANQLCELWGGAGKVHDRGGRQKRDR